MMKRTTTGTERLTAACDISARTHNGCRPHCRLRRRRRQQGRGQRAKGWRKVGPSVVIGFVIGIIWN